MCAIDLHLYRFKRPVITDLSNSNLLYNLNETLLAVMAYGDGVLPSMWLFLLFVYYLRVFQFPAEILWMLIKTISLF